MTHSLPRPARVQAIQVENPTTKTFVLDAATQAVAGQFVMLWLPRLDEKPFSVVDDDPLTVMAAQVGPFTRAIHELPIGDLLWWRGPFGRGFQIEGQRLLLVGGGCGAAPLVLLARQAMRLGCDVTVALGFREAGGLMLLDRFRSLGAKVLVATEDGSLGQRGLATQLAAELIDQGTVDALYGCGPEAMLVALEQMGRSSGIPTQLSWETYIRCGMGICGSCARGEQLVCWDGPVFRTHQSTEPICQEGQSSV